MWAVVAPLLLTVQTSVQVPGVVTPRHRLPAAEADLFAIAQGEHDRREVETRGVLAALAPPYLLLEQGTVRVIVIPMAGAENILPDLVGKSVEVTGFVRRLYERQGTCLQGAPQSYCDDPDLPPTPDRGGRPQSPHQS